jgi:hypothetical protein
LDPWTFLPLGYLLSVLIEGPVLLLGLSPQHPMRSRLLAALWLTACTYPVVALVLPAVVDPVADRAVYLLLAETFAPATECLLFALAFRQRGVGLGRDCALIVLANVLSFAFGEALYRLGTFS